jgi:hypothetical protein
MVAMPAPHVLHQLHRRRHRYRRRPRWHRHRRRCHELPARTIDAGAEITAKANADLRAADVAQQKAIALLSDTSAEPKAETPGPRPQVELASTRLNEASTSMKAAVETGSKAAVDAFGGWGTAVASRRTRRRRR